MVDCFELNGPFRQYFSPYIEPSRRDREREREKEKRYDRREKNAGMYTCLCRPSVARTLMGRLPRLFRTRSCRFGILKDNFIFYNENGILYVSM